MHIPLFKPKERVKIVEDEKATNVNSSTLYEDDIALIDKLINTLESSIKNMLLVFHMNPILFENVSCKLV